MKSINDFIEDISNINEKVGKIVSSLIILFAIKDFFSAEAVIETVLVIVFVLSFWLINSFIKKGQKIKKIINYIYSSILIIMLFSLIIFNNPFFNLIKMNKVDPNKYQDLLANAMLLYSNEQYNEAAEYYRKSYEYAPEEIIKDIVFWREDSLVRSGKPDDAYKVMTTFLEENPSKCNMEDIQLLAVQKLLILCNNKDYKNLEIESNELVKQSQSQVYKEFQMLALVMNNKATELNKLFDTEEFKVYEIDLYRELQIEIWSTLCDYYLQKNDSDRALISLAFLRNIYPEDFERNYFTVYSSLGNIRILSITRKESIVSIFEEQFKSIRINNPIMFEKNEETIVEFGLEIGSVEAFKYFCNKNCINDKTILFKNIDNTLINEHSFVFKILDNTKNKEILWVTAEHLDGELFDEIKPVETFKYRIINISDNNIFITNLDYLADEGNESTTHSFSIESWPNNSKKIIVKRKQGSGEYVYFSIIDIDKKQVVQLKIQPEISYHSFNEATEYDEKTQKTYLKWNFEVDDPSLANVDRKVIGLTIAEVDENSKIQNISVTYPNSAVEFFQKLNTEEIKLSNHLLDKVILCGKEIVNSDFKKVITQNFYLHYKRSMIDDTFTRFPKNMCPNVSAMIVTLDPENILQNNLENKESGIQPFKEYLILVLQEDSKIEILNIYEVEKGKLGKRILRN